MFQQNSDEAYIIAEVGQNHNGCVEEALRYVSVFAEMGANAVKFQLRDNKFLFDESVYDSIYNSENSFGETYGQHREFLELPKSAYPLIKARCELHNVDLIITPFDEPSLDFCRELGVSALKIASFDLGNLPFISKIASTALPVVMSCGGGDDTQIKASVDLLLLNSVNLALLHCVSKYPCPLHEVNLGKIALLKQQYPNVCIGLSDHFNGILTGPLGYSIGARVFEKHVTFDRSQKGTDHPFSLEPDGFRKFCRDIRRTPLLTQFTPPTGLGSEPVFQKLGKSLIASQFIEAGSIVTPEMLSGRITRPPIIPVRNSIDIIGRRALSDIHPNSFITTDMFS